MTRRDGALSRHDGRALQNVAQLADIAGPAMTLEHLHHFVLGADHVTAVLLIHVANYRLRKLRQILQPVPQRGKLDMENVQTIE